MSALIMGPSVIMACLIRIFLFNGGLFILRRSLNNQTIQGQSPCERRLGASLWQAWSKGSVLAS